MQLSGIFRFGSGSAYGGTAGTSPFGNGGTNRVILATAKVYNDPKFNIPDPFNPQYLVSVRDQLYGQNIYRTDLRFTKTFKFTERIHGQAIAECFNVFNHANYGSYQGAITNATFSQPTQNSNLAFGPRQWQFAGRFEF